MASAARLTVQNTKTRSWESILGKLQAENLNEKAATVSANGISPSHRSHEPLNVSGNGYRMGLALVLNANISDYSVTNGKFDGFKVSNLLFLRRDYLST